MNDSQKIDNAIAWYWRNKAKIVAALPIACPGRTFLAGYESKIERYIHLYENGLGNHLAEAYICNPLREIRKKIQAPE